MYTVLTVIVDNNTIVD